MNKLRKAKFSILCDVTSVVRLEEKFEIDHSAPCVPHLFSYDSVCCPSILIRFRVFPIYSHVIPVCSSSILMWFQCVPHLLPRFCVFPIYSHMILVFPIYSQTYDSVCFLVSAVPAMCVEGGGGYRVMNEPDRSELNTDQSNLKCDDSDGLTPGWVRFEGDGGTVMSTSEPPDKRCAAHAPGYLVGGHPEVQDGTVERQVCFVWQSNGCMKDVQIRVRNCGSFYVYELATLGFCKLRYCTDPASSWVSSLICEIRLMERIRDGL